MTALSLPRAEKCTVERACTHSVGQNDRAPHDDRTDLLTKAETVTVAAIEAGVPTLVEAREIIGEFHLMIRRKAAGHPWIMRDRASLVASFASGVATDEAAPLVS